MIMIALDLLLSCYQGILLIYLLRKQFSQVSHSFLYEFFSVLAIVIYFSIIQYFHISIPDNLVLFIPLIYIKLTSDESWISCVLWTVLDGLLFIGTLTLVSGLFNIQIGLNGCVLSASKETIMFYSISSNAILTVVSNVAARFGKAENIISRKETSLFILMLVLCLVVNECFFSARLLENEHNILLIGSACSFAVMILIMVLYERLTETTRKQRMAELEAQTTQIVAQHQDELKSIYKNMLAEQHDLYHRVTAVEELLSSSKIAEIDRRQVLSMLKKTDQPDLIITGNIAVDAILKAKSTIMKNAGITFEFVEYPLNPLPISERSFCMLLGNLLDNAIEGVMRLPASNPTRTIYLSFSKVWEMLFISCTNDADEKKIKRCGSEFVSTKEHPELHGFGTKSMKKIVSDAGGTIDFNIEHGKFSVEIMLGGDASC